MKLYAPIDNDGIPNTTMKRDGLLLLLNQSEKTVLKKHLLATFEKDKRRKGYLNLSNQIADIRILTLSFINVSVNLKVGVNELKLI